MAKTKWVKSRVTDDTYNEVKQLSARLGITAANITRIAVLRYLECQKEAPSSSYLPEASLSQ